MRNRSNSKSRQSVTWQTYEVDFILTSDYQGTITVTARNQSEAETIACDKVLELDTDTMENCGSEVLTEDVRRVGKAAQSATL
jgi:hypothetical protein